MRLIARLARRVNEAGKVRDLVDARGIEARRLCSAPGQGQNQEPGEDEVEIEDFDTFRAIGGMGVAAIGALALAGVGAYGAFKMAAFAAREAGHSIQKSEEQKK